MNLKKSLAVLRLSEQFSILFDHVLVGGINLGAQIGKVDLLLLHLGSYEGDSCSGTEGTYQYGRACSFLRDEQ